MLHKGFSCRRVVVEKHHYHHKFARRRGAYHKSTQETCMVAEVEKFEPMLESVATYLVANSVRYIVLQPTLIDVEHLIEHLRNMKSESAP